MIFFQRHLNLHTFGVYTFSYYKSLEIKNYRFEENILPVYLKDIMEDRNTLRYHLFGKIYLTYDADPRIIIGKAIDTVEEKSFLPALFNYENQRFYREAAALTLLAILSDSYHFANVDEAIREEDEELFTILMKKCHMEEFVALSKTFCLRETRDKLEREIWDRLNLLH